MSKINLECSLCDHEKNAKKGTCLIKKGADNLSIMCVGSWAIHKHYYLQRYLDIFHQSMRRKWNLYYIDLFCGSGRSILRETGEEVEGSPLIALRFNFARYFFVDIEKENIKVLRERCKSRTNFEKIKFICQDSNRAIKLIKKEIPECSLSLAFIDPFGLDFDFSSYLELTKTHRIDLIINFPLETAIKRNWSKSTFDKTKLDKFLGGTDWRPVKGNPAIHFIKYFKRNLEKINYTIPKKEFPLGDVVIKSTKNKIPLYRLLFASKHQLGHKLWNKIRKYDPVGQPSLFQQ